MPIPEFNTDGFLPEGIHSCGEDEFLLRFGYNTHRRRFIQDGLMRVTKYLARKGIKTIFIGGSMVTAKELPRDIDAFVITPLKNPLFFEILMCREQWKRLYSVDLLPAQPFGKGEITEEGLKCFFSENGKKGLIKLLLQGESHVSD